MVLLTELELLPGSSSSSSTRHDNHNYRYDVFLSFRSVDTRNNFTDHLYNALVDADIITFLDDEELETGEKLKPELESAIKSSRASIIVLSKNYASSTWCLEELVLILEQNRNFNQIVIPIFYHVSPTNMQQSSIVEAMAKHKLRTEADINSEIESKLAQKMESWKRALTQVANFKGKDAKNRKEAEFIKEIVTDIHRRLRVPLSKNLPHLIGMDHHIQFISSWLTDGSCHTADILTVVGMGGMGKTSLAKYVYQFHAGKFHKSSFIEGINARCNERFNGLLDLQKQLYGDISKKTALQVNDVSVYTSQIENAPSRKRVFIVLDDIGSLDELDALLGNKGLHRGSKIIVTTKDASLAERYALFNPQVQPKHTKVLLDGLCETESLELLCINAFKMKNPKEGYQEVSEKLAKYCDGHPLALEVLGKSLRKSTENADEWEYYIEVLKMEPHSHIIKALQMSFDSLPFNNDKDLFKHIACFFVGMDKDLTETILNSCGIKTRYGITNLIDRCLLSIRDNKLMMHQLVQEMGRDLVRQESIDKPSKRTRLWCHKESFKVLKHKKSKRNLLGLALDMRLLDKKKLRGSFELEKDSLRKMDNLMLLQLNYVQLNGCFQTFPEELRWLCMHGFPLKSIRLDLPMKNLVYLDMSFSNITSFDMYYSNSQPPSKRQKLVGSWSKGERLLGSLKILDLSFCKNLHSLGGFLEIPALERLIVVNCVSLIEVCKSLDHCVELIHIYLSYCLKLKRFPVSIGKLKKVQTLLLDGCNFCESQIEMWDTNSLDISINSQTSSSTIVDTIPSDVKFFVSSLPSSLIVLSLANNNLSNESFPGDFSCLLMLEELCLDDNPIISMPKCVRSFPKLKKLSMENCEMVISIEHPPCTLKVLSVGHRNTSLRKIKFNTEMSPLNIDGPWKLLSPSYEIDGMVKIQPLTCVEEKVLHSLGWKNLDFIKERRLKTCTFGGSDKSQTKMYYEFGIFSTMYYEKKGMPNWIKNTSKGPSISFTIPSSPKKLRGLNFCYVETMRRFSYDTFVLPMIKITNITKEHTWIYNHYIDKVKVEGKFLNLLSHWMFGPEEMTTGDQITINVAQRYCKEQFTRKCGVNVMFGDGKNDEEEDGLGYYKSWNHIIGGDLSAFQTSKGEYLLSSMHFFDGSRYKEKEVSFKAFSQKRSKIIGDASEDTSK